MNIKISVYDFFAYTIPGFIILFTILYAYTIFGSIQIDFLSINPSIAQIAVLLGVCYIIGLVFDSTGKLWYRVFKPMNFPNLVLTEFKQSHPALEIKFQAADWPILLAYIKYQNIDVVTDIERMNASNIMLRNVSVAFIGLSLVQIVKFIQVLSMPYLVIGIAFIVSAVILGKESVKYARWFYLGIFEAIAANSLNVSDLLTNKDCETAS